MNCENYEKKYKEALERAQKFEEKYGGGYAGLIFPELAESEDERIREFLIDLLSHGTWKKDWPFSPAECVAWLEKQKEQKPAEWSDKLDIDTLHDWSMRFAPDIREAIEATAYHFYNISPQSKQEWSEEDEKRVKQLIYDTEHIRAEYEKRKKELGESFNDELIKDCDEQITWLKSLCPQPKVEWSKEDEEIFNNIIEKAKGGHWIEVNEISWLITRFKSLCPQPHTVSIKDATKFGNLEYERGVKDGIQHSENHRWKPSEEQMQALEYVIRDYREDSCNATANYLQEILDHLKNM